MAGSKTILFIEDDHVIGEMYTNVLQNAGYAVTRATNGENGIKLAQSGNFDIALLDILLPEKTGVEILEELKGHDGSKLPQTKIVVLTNFEQDEESRVAMERMADGYLIKADITPRKLVELLKQLEETGEAIEYEPEKL